MEFQIERKHPYGIQTNSSRVQLLSFTEILQKYKLKSYTHHHVRTVLGVYTVTRINIDINGRSRRRM